MTIFANFVTLETSTKRSFLCSVMNIYWLCVHVYGDLGIYWIGTTHLIGSQTLSLSVFSFKCSCGLWCTLYSNNTIVLRSHYLECFFLLFIPLTMLNMQRKCTNVKYYIKHVILFMFFFLKRCWVYLCALYRNDALMLKSTLSTPMSVTVQ